MRETSMVSSVLQHLFHSSVLTEPTPGHNPIHIYPKPILTRPRLLTPHQIDANGSSVAEIDESPVARDKMQSWKTHAAEVISDGT